MIANSVCAPACGRGPAVDDEAIRPFLRVDTERTEACDECRDAVAFLDAELLRAGHLETASGGRARSEDRKLVDEARDLLDLAITNYAVASESGDDADLNDCSEIAAGIINACNLLSAGSLDEARAAYDGAASTYAGLPPPADPDGLPEGLADIQADILAAFTDSASILASGGTTGDGLGVSTGTASPI